MSFRKNHPAGGGVDRSKARRQFKPSDSIVDNLIVRPALAGSNTSDFKIGAALPDPAHPVSTLLTTIAKVLGMPVETFIQGVEAEHPARDWSPPTQETDQLVLAFSRIRHPVVRQKLMEMTKALADDES